jgi:putative transcriptional regulator
MNNQTIYTCLKQLRQSADLTQAELAKKVHTSRQTICAMEKGDYIPSLKLALLIGNVFKQPVEAVFHLDKKKCG